MSPSYRSSASPIRHATALGGLQGYAGLQRKEETSRARMGDHRSRRAKAVPPRSRPQRSGKPGRIVRVYFVAGLYVTA